MNTNIYKGFRGEAIARRYLVENGYKILATNFRSSGGEADIVATDNSSLVFVEVKAHSMHRYGQPADSVDVKKRQNISQAASFFVKKYQIYGVPLRFDIIEIFSGEINHIKNAFEIF